MIVVVKVAQDDDFVARMGGPNELLDDGRLCFPFGTPAGHVRHGNQVHPDHGDGEVGGDGEAGEVVFGEGGAAGLATRTSAVLDWVLAGQWGSPELKWVDARQHAHVLSQRTVSRPRQVRPVLATINTVTGCVGQLAQHPAILDLHHIHNVAVQLAEDVLHALQVRPGLGRRLPGALRARTL